MPDETLQYAQFVRDFEKSSQEEKYRADLFSGKANLIIGDKAEALKYFTLVADKTQTVTGAEAKYNVASLQYQKGEFKTSIATALDLADKMSSHDYWVAKTFILVADNYVSLKDNFQAKSTLQSVIDNYESDDDEILATAKEKLAAIK